MDKLVLQAVEEVALEGPEGKLGAGVVRNRICAATECASERRLYRWSALAAVGKSPAARSQQAYAESEDTCDC